MKEEEFWKSVWQEARWLLAAGGAPCLGFVIGILLAFWIYPNDAEGAGKLLMTFAGAGALVGIFLVVHRLRYWLKQIPE